jgi:hypothetical protein
MKIINSPYKRMLNALFIENTRVINSVLRQIRSNSENYDESKIGLVISALAIGRLKNSVSAAQSLLRKGYVFEVASIYRLIFEQLAWIYTIYDAKEINNLKVSPRSCLTKFKRVYPKGGRIYGLLSGFAHVEPNNISNYLKITKEDQGIRFEVTRPELPDIIQQALLLTFLVYLIAAVQELITKDRIIKIRYSKFTNGILELSDKCLVKLDRYQKCLDRLRLQKDYDRKLRLVYSRVEIESKKEL